MSAYESWLAASGFGDGPVFRAIDRWGTVASEGLAAASIVPLLRRLFTAAGVADVDDYSSHSLRRGFAGWANASGWDIKELMEYVGWRDIKSAIRYLDVSPKGLKERFERGLPGAPEDAREEPATYDKPQSKVIRFPIK